MVKVIDNQCGSELARTSGLSVVRWAVSAVVWVVGARVFAAPRLVRLRTERRAVSEPGRWSGRIYAACSSRYSWWRPPKIGVATTPILAASSVRIVSSIRSLRGARL